MRPMSDVEVAEADSVIARIRARRRSDPRLVHTTSKGLSVVSCVYCGRALSIGENLDDAIALAVRNNGPRPCCDLWRVP